MSDQTYPIERRLSIRTPEPHPYFNMTTANKVILNRSTCLLYIPVLVSRCVTMFTRNDENNVTNNLRNVHCFRAQ